MNLKRKEIDKSLAKIVSWQKGEKAIGIPSYYIENNSIHQATAWRGSRVTLYPRPSNCLTK
jgi:hypothetical protein